MTDAPVIRRIAMWSGPRNISTTMMRSFENRPDCAVIDEPLYAHYLNMTGADHPMREAVLQSQPTDWRTVVARLVTDQSAPIVFQKHMAHHVTPDVDRAWLGDLDHVVLIRDPARMALSFADRMGAVTPEDLGLAAEVALYDAVCERKGVAPPVIDAADVLADSQRLLSALCEALAIPFVEEMLSWPAGPRESDGVWAPHWYRAVQASTGFRAPPEETPTLPPHLDAVVDAVRPHYDRLHALRLRG